MDYQSEKCVMVIDGALPTGVIANTAAILGVTLGKRQPDAVGPDVTDKGGRLHLGIVALPVPILRTDGLQLKHAAAAVGRDGEGLEGGTAPTPAPTDVKMTYCSRSTSFLI